MKETSESLREWDSKIRDSFSCLIPGAAVGTHPKGFAAALGDGYTLEGYLAGPHQLWSFTLRSEDGRVLRVDPFSATDLYSSVEHILHFLPRPPKGLALDLATESFREFYIQVCESLGVESNWDEEGFRSAHVFRRIARLRAVPETTAECEADDTIKRPAGCKCQWEEGDSPCPVQGEGDAPSFFYYQAQFDTSVGCLPLTLVYSESNYVYRV